jgi:DNA-binding LacI/PurR family transcriptional regulator
MHRQVSIKDLARFANVSQSTVSRALRNSSLVNAETTEKIQRLAREHGYRASLVARSLVTRETKAIGCVVSSIADPFVAQVISGVYEAATQTGYALLLANSNTDPEREIEAVLSFQDRRVDGILVVASRVGDRYGAHLASMRLPIVLINNQHSATHIHSLMIDNVAAAQEATRHLTNLGHRRIAYLGSTAGQFSDEERREGYRSVMKELGLALHPELLVQGDGTPNGGEQAVREMLSQPVRPTAIFCYDDLLALGAYRAIYTAGLSIPDDISVVGFDDVFFAPYTVPPLTTMRQPMLSMGRSAMELLVKLCAGQEISEQVLVKAELVMRASTAPPLNRS